MWTFPYFISIRFRPYLDGVRIFTGATLIRCELVLLGIEYGSPLLEFLRESLFTKEAIDPEDLDQMLGTDSPLEAVSFIQGCTLERFGLR
jgi:hypothetical protein